MGDAQPFDAVPKSPGPSLPSPWFQYTEFRPSRAAKAVPMPPEAMMNPVASANDAAAAISREMPVEQRAPGADYSEFQPSRAAKAVPMTPKAAETTEDPVAPAEDAATAISRDVPVEQHTPVYSGPTTIPEQKEPRKSRELLGFQTDPVVLTPEQVKAPPPPKNEEAARASRSSLGSEGRGSNLEDRSLGGGSIDVDSLASRIRSSKQRLAALSGGLEKTLRGEPPGELSRFAETPEKLSHFGGTPGNLSEFGGTPGKLFRSRVEEQFGLNNELQFPPRETTAPSTTMTGELPNSYENDEASTSVQKLKHTSNRVVKLVDANKFLHVPDENTQKVMFTNAIWNRLHKGHEFDGLLAARSTSRSGISTERVRIIVGLDMHAWEYETTWADQDYLLWQLARDFQEALKVDAECVNIHSQGWKGPYMVTVQLTRTSAAAHSGFTEDVMAEVLRGIADKEGPLSRGRVSQYLTSVLVQRVPVVGASDLLHAVDDPDAPARRRLEEDRQLGPMAGGRTTSGRKVDLRVMVARASAARAITLGQELVVEAVVDGQRQRTLAGHGPEVDYNEVLTFKGVGAEEALQLSLHVKQAALLLPLGSIVIPARRFPALHHVLETSALNKASGIDKLHDEATGATISFVLETMDGDDDLRPLTTDSVAATPLGQSLNGIRAQPRELPTDPSVGSPAPRTGSPGSLRAGLHHSQAGFYIHDPLAALGGGGVEQVEARGAGQASHSDSPDQARARASDSWLPQQPSPQLPAALSGAGLHRHDAQAGLVGPSSAPLSLDALQLSTSRPLPTPPVSDEFKPTE